MQKLRCGALKPERVTVLSSPDSMITLTANKPMFGFTILHYTHLEKKAILANI